MEEGLPAAAAVLADLVAHHQPFAGGICIIGDPKWSDPAVIDTTRLPDAIARTDPARHGRDNGGQLTRADADALLALDPHPALRSLTGRYMDELWRRGEAAARNEEGRAVVYAALVVRLN